VEAQAKAGRGTPVAAESWRLGPYLDHWLENVIKPTRRPATYDLYEMVTRLYLKPGLGRYWLRQLSVSHVQRFLNAQMASGRSLRNVHIMRQVLSVALARADREELVSRNVARLAELPTWQPAEVQTWSGDEALAFLRTARNDPLYPVRGDRRCVMAVPHSNAQRAALTIMSTGETRDSSTARFVVG
jgi:hypothetical protein